MSFSLGNDKFLFGMLYINLLNLVWFWSRISINYLFRFNIKDNGIRYYNFDIVPCFELFILLLLRESHIATQIWNLVCLSRIMIFVYINFECVCIYNYGEFYFINLRIINYFLGFGNYVLDLNNVQC